MSNQQDSVISAEGRNREGEDSVEDPHEENHPAAAGAVPGGTGVRNSIHDITVDMEHGNIDRETHEQPFHLANPAPTFEQVENKVWSWVVNLPGWRWERQTRGQTQCIRCQLLKLETQHIGSNLRATPIMGPDSASIRQVHDYTNWQLEQRSVAVNVGVGGGQFGIDSTIQYSTSKNHQSYIHRYYVVIGVFSKADNLPQERIIFFTNPRRLFRYLFWAIVRLRGITGLFSLKDVKGFALYTCNWETGAHKRLKLDEKGVTDMQLLLWAYKSRSDRVGEGWAQWIHETLNDHSENPRTSPPGKAISIEVIMGWSIFRISIIVLLPVFLSLAVGFWLNSRAWNDLATIQTAWGVASYIATAGARRLSNVDVSKQITK